MKRLPDTELEVMKALWELGAGTSRPALEQALAYARGNRALAARVLGISRTALYQKLERFRLS